MNKLLNRIFLILLSAFLAAHSLYAENPDNKSRIALLEIKNISGRKELDRTASIIKTTLSQSLRIFGEYEIVEIPDSGNTGNDNYLNQLAENINADYIVFGSLSREAREIITEVSIFSGSSGITVETQRKVAGNPIALRSDVRNILIETLSYFTEHQVYFTSLTFTNMSSYHGDYQVYIDTIPFGKNIEHIEYLLSGKRDIKIDQQRMTGSHTLAEITSVLNPADRVSIEFSIPGFLKKEQKLISMYEKTIDRYFDDIYRSQRTAGAFQRAFSRLADTSYSSLAEEKKQQFTQKYYEWEKNREEWNITRGLTAADMPVSAGFKVLSMTASYHIDGWDSALEKPSSGGGASIGAGVFVSHALNRYTGIQGEFLVYNQKTGTVYTDEKTGYSSHFIEAPLIAYLRLPEYLLKFYAGLSVKYRITVMNTETVNYLTGDIITSKFDEDLLRMYNTSWLAGLSLEMPFHDNIFFMDFRYNKDMDSWYRSAAVENSFIADYISFSTGFAVKAGR